MDRAETMDELGIRLATPSDTDRIVGLIRAAAKYMHSHGNPSQWSDTYPGRALIEGEIAASHCHVVLHGGRIVGTFCLIIGEDPTYSVIEDGAWMNAAPYGTIHRLASDGAVHGVAKRCFEYCYAQIRNIRVDTHRDNATMLRLLGENGFSRCGVIHIADGSPRIAFQKSDGIKTRLQGLVCERFLGEARYRRGHLSIVNALPGTTILGVHIPELKALARSLRKEGIADEVVDGFEAQAAASARRDAADRLCHEEKLLWGLLICGMGDGDAAAALRRAGKFIPLMANWAECDTFCCNAHWKFLRGGEGRKRLWAFIRPLFRSKREFEVRSAVVLSLCHFLEEECLEEVFAALGDIDYDGIATDYADMAPKPYYVKMGVAWLLATALCKWPGRTRAFLKSASLPPDVLRLYVRKVRESRRTHSWQPFG